MLVALVELAQSLQSQGVASIGDVGMLLESIEAAADAIAPIRLFDKTSYSPVQTSYKQLLHTENSSRVTRLFLKLSNATFGNCPCCSHV